MLKLRILIVPIVAAALLFAVSATAQVIVLTRATVIDGTGTGAQKDFTIIMENGRIRDIGPSSKTPAPAGATVLDLSGKFIAPGIINAHGHVGAKTEPQLRPVRALRCDYRDEHADRSG
jgi:imidazolonepropionase-like amidohydrolase